MPFSFGVPLFFISRPISYQRVSPDTAYLYVATRNTVWRLFMISTIALCSFVLYYTLQFAHKIAINSCSAYRYTVVSDTLPPRTLTTSQQVQVHETLKIDTCTSRESPLNWRHALPHTTASLCNVLASPPFRNERNPEGGPQVKMKNVNVSTGFPPPCAKSTGPADGFLRAFGSGTVSVRTSFISQFASVLGLVRRSSSRTAGVKPGEANVVLRPLAMVTPLILRRSQIMMIQRPQ